MTKKLQEVFNLPQEEIVVPEMAANVAEQPVINLQDKLEEFDKKIEEMKNKEQEYKKQIKE